MSRPVVLRHILLALASIQLSLAQTPQCDTSTCQGCDVSTQCATPNTPSQNRNALVQLYTSLGGPHWNDGRYNTWNTVISGTCRDASNQVWPAEYSYCCWGGVTCCNSTTANGLVSQFIGALCTRGAVWSLVLNRVVGRAISNNNTIMCKGKLYGPFGGLTGVFPMQPLCTLRCTLQILSLTYNNLTGTLPAGLSSLQQLRTLFLSYNKFVGQIPRFYNTELTNGLSSLSQLDLQQNCLTGSLPSDVCRGNLSSKLVDVTVAFNALTGPMRLATCETLILLDAANNQFTGNVAIQGAKGLHILRLQNNLFDGTLGNGNGNFVGTNSTLSLVTLVANNNSIRGTIPADIAFFEFLSSINLADNRLNGSIPSSLSQLVSLSALSLQNNSLTGSIPEGFTALGNLNSMNLSKNLLSKSIPSGIWFSPALTSLDLSENRLTGTVPPSLTQLQDLLSLRLNDNFLTASLPEELGNITTLTALILYNNFLTGPIPASFQNASQLRLLTSGNYLSCCGYNFNNDTQQYEAIDMSNGFLPPWLMVKPGLLNPSADLLLSCPALQVYDDGQLSDVMWDLAPSYYLYHNCTCISNYHLVNNSVDPNANATTRRVYGGLMWVMQCEADPSFWEANKYWLIPVICVGCVVFILSVLFFFGHRTVLVRSFVSARKRLQGVPSSGRITIVVTDIEGYSDMMKQAPELMTSALNIHNAVIRKAKWTNFGYTVEQEGDSYAIAFHEAVDAAAFCLMAQQGFMKQEWPEGLFEDNRAFQGGKRMSAGQQVMSSVNQFASALGSRLMRQLPELEGSVAAAEGSLGGGSEAASYARESRDSGGSEKMRSLGTGLSGMLSPRVSQVIKNASRALFSKRNSGMGSGDLLWSGVRVRMGMATGVLPPRTTIRGCAVMEEAKLVSDAGCGGQLLMDERTFMVLKDRLEELGAVDHNGLNHARMNAKRPWWYLWLPLSHTSIDEAIILDMGEYRQCPSGELPLLLMDIGVFGANSAIDSTAAATPATRERSAEGMRDDKATGGTGAGGEKDGATGQRGDKTGAGGGGAAGGNGNGGAGALDGGDGNKHVPIQEKRAAFNALITASLRRGDSGRSPKGVAKRIRLMQILPYCLAGRAKTFMNNLALKPEWLMVDSPYFAAPGTPEAPICKTDPGGELPSVTMVFAMVDGGKQFALTHRRDARHVHTMCVAVIRATLRSVRGGYLCRTQDGDFKYLICFKTPDAALQWCLLLQQVLIYADWPDASHRYDKFKTEWTPDGKLLFRGPRMKMGVCEGQPNTIIPDHLGRADYHGASINQAARFMDAGAHGGQIVCEEALALKVFDIWQRDMMPETSIGGSAITLEGGGPSRAMTSTSSQCGPPPRGTSSAPSSVTGPSMTSGATIEGGGNTLAESYRHFSDSSLLKSQRFGSQIPLAQVVEEHSETDEDAAFAAAAADRSSSGLSPSTPVHAVPPTESAVAALADSTSNSPASEGQGGEGSGYQMSDARESVTNSSLMLFASRPSMLASSAGQGGESSSAGMGYGGMQPHIPANNVATRNLLSRFAPGLQLAQAIATGVTPASSEKGVLVTCQPRPVFACRTGVFKFKGSPENITMVHVVLGTLLNRRFPADPPKGKGNRVAEASGVVAEGTMPLPTVANTFLERFEGMHPSGDHALTVADSPIRHRRVNWLPGSQSFSNAPPVSRQDIKMTSSFAVPSAPVPRLELQMGIGTTVPSAIKRTAVPVVPPAAPPPPPVPPAPPPSIPPVVGSAGASAPDERPPPFLLHLLPPPSSRPTDAPAAPADKWPLPPLPPPASTAPTAAADTPPSMTAAAASPASAEEPPTVAPAAAATAVSDDESAPPPPAAAAVVGQPTSLYLNRNMFSRDPQQADG